MTTPQPIVEEVTLTPQEALADRQERLQQLLVEWKNQREIIKEIVTELDKTEREVKVLQENAKKQEQEEVVKGPFEQARKRNQPISGEVRALIAKKVLEENMTYKQASETYDVSRSSVGRIVKEAREERKRQLDEEEGTPHTEPPRKRKKRGRKEKIDSETLLSILGWIEDDPRVTLKEICRRLKDQTTVGQVSISTLNRKLDKVDITYKDMLDIPNRWNTEEVIVRRREYVRNVFQVGFRPLVFLDECPFNINTHARKGRAVKGHTPNLTVHHKGRNITLLAAMDKNGILFYKLIASTESKAGVNADDFRLFLVSLTKHLPQNGVIILDNASIHHETEVQDYYEELRKSSHKVDTRFLPPYSPFLNPGKM
jgi:transposase